MSTARRNVIGAVIGLVAAGVFITIVDGDRTGLLVVAFLGCITFAFYSFGRLLYLQLTLHRYKKPGTTWPVLYSLNTFKISPESLTEQGRKNLREIVRCYFLFCGAILLPLILHGLLW